MKKYLMKIINKLLQLFRNNAQRLSLFVIIFGFAKATVFFAPLLLSNLAGNAETYGYVEYLLALGATISGVFNLGMSGAYPYFNIRLKEQGYTSVFYFHLLLNLGVLILAIVLGNLSLIPPKILFSILLCLFLNCASSVEFKTSGLSNSIIRL